MEVFLQMGMQVFMEVFFSPAVEGEQAVVFGLKLLYWLAQVLFMQMVV